MGRSIVSLDDITPNNIGVFQKINEVCFPVTFPEQWYKDCLEKGVVEQLGFYAEIPVAGVKAKPFNTSHSSSSHTQTQQHQIATNSIPNAMYVESLAVLPAYQGLGIGSQLLEYVIEETKKRFIHEVFLHVQVSNTHAVEWYKKRGFEVSEEVPKYYHDQGLESPDAVILRKKI
jgi:GNAT superfamily N-acetyltransferase